MRVNKISPVSYQSFKSKLKNNTQLSQETNKPLEKILEICGNYVSIDEFREAGGYFKNGVAMTSEDIRSYKKILVKQKDGYRLIDYINGKPNFSIKFDNFANGLSIKEYYQCEEGSQYIIFNRDLLNFDNSTKTYITKRLNSSGKEVLAKVKIVSADEKILKEWS